MIKRTIALGTVAITAVIVLFATGPEVATHQAQVWPQVANAQIRAHLIGSPLEAELKLIQ